MIELQEIDELDLAGKRVFYRVDYNVPLEGGKVTDATRIEATIPTIRLMRERGARILIASHLGRPKGERVTKYSLEPVGDELSRILGLDIGWVSDCVGADVVSRAEALGPGQILLLENLRYHAGEELNDPEFSAELAALGEVYVNDAFGACHRSHASIVGAAERFAPEHRAAGLLISKEVDFLERVTTVTDDERPFVAILGGAKIKGKIEPLETMVRVADVLLIGGGMANTFLAAEGRSMGTSLVDSDSIDLAKRLLREGGRASVILPADLVVTDSIEAPTRVRTVDADTIEAGEMAVDIGMQTVTAFVERIGNAKTIFWNGPMGVFEKAQFAEGTFAIARAVAEANAISIVGGGESVDAVMRSGVSEHISHISTGGGASLEFIANGTLPGLEVLRKRSDGTGD